MLLRPDSRRRYSSTVSTATRGHVDPPASLQLLRDAFVRVGFPLQTDGAEAAEDVRDAVVDQLDDYVLPRLARLDAPLLAVIGGSTGAGKSTLVNALVGDVVSIAGVRRPTTRLPVLVHHPADAAWFSSDQLLPTLTRVTSTDGADDDMAVRLVSSSALTKGIGFLDAPDVDSVATRNRQLAKQLLAAADLWIFVTSGSRYADAVPWNFLREAAERCAVVAIVLDRVDETAVDEITTDLRRLLAAEGLAEASVFAVTEATLDVTGMLPAGSIEPIAEWLGVLAGDPAARASVARQTLGGAVASIVRRVPEVVTEAGEQIVVRDQLSAIVTAGYDAAVNHLRAASTDGTLMRGEVLAHWRELVGAGEPGQTADVRLGRFRGRAVAAVTGRSDVETDLAGAFEADLAALLVATSASASRRVLEAWQGIPAALTLIADPANTELGRTPADLPTRATAAIRTWQHAVIDLVRGKPTTRRAWARAVSFGANGLGVVVMMDVLSRSAAPTDPESARTSNVLASVLGDQEASSLVEQAQGILDRRVSTLMYDERSGFDRAIDRLRIPDDQLSVLTTALAAAALVPESLPT